MTTEILLIASCVFSYAAIGALTGTIVDAWFPIQEYPLAFLAGLLWPLGLPVLIGIVLGMSIRWAASGVMQWATTPKPLPSSTELKAWKESA